MIIFLHITFNGTSAHIRPFSDVDDANENGKKEDIIETV